MNLVTLLFPNAAAFLERYDAGGARVRADTKAEVGVGDDVVLEIQFPEVTSRVLVRAKVVAARPNCTFQIERDYRADCEFLEALARGKVPATGLARSHTRYPSRIPVSCRVDSGSRIDCRFVSEVEDLSSGGAFVRSAEVPAVGTRVRLYIGPLAGQHFIVYGEVAWRDKNQGFGVRFTATPPGPSLRAVLRRSAESGRLAFAA